MWLTIGTHDEHDVLPYVKTRPCALDSSTSRLRVPKDVARAARWCTKTAFFRSTWMLRASETKTRRKVGRNVSLFVIQ